MTAARQPGAHAVVSMPFRGAGLGVMTTGGEHCALCPEATTNVRVNLVV